jgi:hypothetical protein
MTPLLRILGDDFTLPDETTAELGWGAGDVLNLSVVDGRLLVSRAMTTGDWAVALARRGFAKYRETFEALAKT